MQEPKTIAPVVLLTRPEAAARRFADEIAPLGLRVVIAPMQRIVPVDHDADAIRTARGLVFTSENGVRFAGAGNGRPAWCVGPRTGEVARQAGYDVSVGPGDAARLMPLIADLGPGWLHPHGAHLAARLTVPGIVVYDQHPLPLSPEAKALLQGDAPVILPLFSPRSARLAAEEIAPLPGRTSPLLLIQISGAAQTEWDRGWQGACPGPRPRSVIADHPDAEGIFRAMRSELGAERSDITAG